MIERKGLKLTAQLIIHTRTCACAHTHGRLLLLAGEKEAIAIERSRGVKCVAVLTLATQVLLRQKQHICKLKKTSERKQCQILVD